MGITIQRADKAIDARGIMGMGMGREVDKSEGLGVGSFIMGAIIGSLAMFMLDPQEGPRRRALTKDKFTKFKNDFSNYSGKAARDIRNRAQGVVAEAKRPLQ